MAACSVCQLADLKDALMADYLVVLWGVCWVDCLAHCLARYLVA